MNRFQTTKSALVWATALLSSGVLGCTQMTIPNLPDAGPEEDAQVDSGSTPQDGGLPPPVIETCTPEGMGSTIGQSCTNDTGCDDGCFCNGAEACEGGVCVAASDPCADTVDCTADACLEEANRCFHEPQHEMCGDGNACNGTELCDVVMGCVAGTPPYCNDETSCTLDSCDVTMGCVFVARDLDHDGYSDGRCGGDDCDDDPRYGGVAIHPGATEVCDNRRDDDCDGARDYNDDDCFPTNDTCESAVVLPGPGTYSGSTRGLASNYGLSCRGSGPDAVFRFTLTEDHDVTVTVAGGGSGTGVSLRPFAQCASGPDEKCSISSPPSFLRRSLPAGDYAIIVQTSSPGAAFDLNLRIGDPTAIPPVDQCNAGTQDLCGGAPCTTVTSATFSGMFVEVEDDYTLSCSSGSGNRDAVYQFTLDAPKDVTLTASTGSSSNTYLSLTTDCATTDAAMRCTQGSWGGAAEIRQRELGPGTYFVIIETDDSSTPTWNLRVTITDPVPRTTGDACSTAIDISERTEGGGGMGSVSISTLDLDSGTSCGGDTSGYRDANFMFTLASTRDVTITTSNPSTWSTYYGTLETVCGNNSTAIRCWSGSGTLAQTWRSLPAGTYYLTTSTSDTSGSLSARIVTSAPTPIPPNDRCSGAIVLTSGASRRDTTSGFEDDAPGGTCTWGSMPDAFYTFTLTTRTTVLLSVADADPSSTTFYLTLRNACGSGASLDCMSGSPATINHTLEPGTYYLQVETDTFSTSDYFIYASFFPTP